MTPEEFKLQHSVPPRRDEFDIDPVTEDWPMPPARKWEPATEAKREFAFPFAGAFRAVRERLDL